VKRPRTPEAARDDDPVAGARDAQKESDPPLRPEHGRNPVTVDASIGADMGEVGPALAVHSQERTGDEPAAAAVRSRTRDRAVRRHMGDRSPRRRIKDGAVR
jgi:hypothetical protein